MTNADHHPIRQIVDALHANCSGHVLPCRCQCGDCPERVCGCWWQLCDDCYLGWIRPDEDDDRHRPPDA